MAFNPEDYRLAFAAQLRTVMESTGVSGQDLAHRLKVQQQTISRWRSGRRYPSTEVRRRLEKALGVEPFTFEPGRATMYSTQSPPVRRVAESRDPTDPWPRIHRRIADLMEAGQSMPPEEAARWMYELDQWLRGQTAAGKA